MLSYYANRLRITRNPLERQALLILLDWLWSWAKAALSIYAPNEPALLVTPTNNWVSAALTKHPVWRTKFRQTVSFTFQSFSEASNMPEQLSKR